MVTKLTVYPHKILGTPEVAVRVFEYDQQNQALGDLLVSQSAGTVSPGLNAKVLTFDPPFTVMEPTFCVGYESAPGETQLAVKVDTTANISGLSVLWIFNNDDCEVGPEPLTELYKDAPNPRFCMDVEIVAP